MMRWWPSLQISMQEPALRDREACWLLSRSHHHPVAAAARKNHARCLRESWEGGPRRSSHIIVARPVGAVGHLFLATSSRRLQLTPEQREQQNDRKRNAQEP
jgi:hypothetical protein